MKIAIVTDDGSTVGQHFGRAEKVMVVRIEQGRVVEHELRDKPGHRQFSHEHDPEEGHDGGHGRGPDAHRRHARMAEAISDCQAVICGGMGLGAYESMKSRGIQPVVTEVVDIDAAALAYAQGTLVDRRDRLH
jgi:predicted Fe-Mo cluster-binding NifX family protein